MLYRPVAMHRSCCYIIASWHSTLHVVSTGGHALVLLLLYHCSMALDTSCGIDRWPCIGPAAAISLQHGIRHFMLYRPVVMHWSCCCYIIAAWHWTLHVVSTGGHALVLLLLCHCSTAFDTSCIDRWPCIGRAAAISLQHGIGHFMSYRPVAMHRSCCCYIIAAWHWTLHVVSTGGHA